MLVEMNLDSREAVTLPAVARPIDFADDSTYSNVCGDDITTDAKGQDVVVTYYFQKTGGDSWNVYATANNSTVADGGGTPPHPVPVTT